MGLIDLRELRSSFPNVGDNSTDTIISGIHFNLTALNKYNYTYYDTNNTISNRSRCYIIDDKYQPHMFANGSWVNATSCYVPIYGVKTRGKLGIAFAACFAISVMFTLLNLKKHGQVFLREEKRFRVVGRRWQWYWMCFVAACAIISCITGIDVDRAYLQQIAIVLQSFFYCLMLPGTLAMVWEAVRHWGSWQERQICDRDPLLLPQNDRRSRVEFFLPLIFYLFAWLNFFMTIPRSWTAIQMQRSPSQQKTVAEPSGTDSRFKAGSILAAISWLVICYSLRHSIHYYKPRAHGLWGSLTGFCQYCPTKLFLAIVILALRIAYAIASAWEWNISIFKYDVNPAWPFALGYGPALLLIVLFNVFGYVDENEDKQLIAQRRNRGRAADAELGYVKKPSWWSKVHGDVHLTPEQRLRALTTEVGGGRPTTRNITANLELGNMRAGARAESVTGGLRDRSRSRPAEDPFRDQSPEERGRRGVERRESDNASTMTGATGTTLAENAQPVRIRSMLDV